MIVILHPDSSLDTEEGKAVMSYLSSKSGITPRTHSITGADRTLSEIYVIGNVAALDQAEIESLPGVEKVVRVSREYRVIGRHAGDVRDSGFTYNGVRFDQHSLHVFAGLCAVDNPQNVETMMKILQEHQIMPGNKHKVVEKTNVMRSISLESEKGPTSIPFHVAEKIFVFEVSPDKTSSRQQ